MKKKIGIITLIFIIINSSLLTYAADGTSYVYDAYIYDFWANVLECPAPFNLYKVVTENTLEGITLSGIDDVSTSEDGRIFLTDTKESYIHAIDVEGTLLFSIKMVRNENGKIALDSDTGKQIMLTSPEGTFIHEKQSELYIADTGAERILVLDLDTYALKRVIGKPENMTGSTEFKPSKLVVDFTDRIFVVVQSSYEGIVELNADGSFFGYYGVNTPRINLIEYFWKSIASSEQKEQMSKTYAPAFSNITLDGEGFVMAVTSDTASADYIFRLNSQGKNVLREEGNWWTKGRIYFDSASEMSQFVDLAVTDYGTYAALDKSKGQIFIYNFDGELLSIFGSLGNAVGQFKQPSSIAWLGDKLIVTDTAYKSVYILTPSDFGRAAFSASREYYNGNWDAALVEFEEAIRLNANYEVAYSGIGKNYLMKDDYEKSMYNFKLGNNRTYYSKAYNGYRGEKIRENFYIIVIVFVLLIGALIYSEVRYHKKGGKKK